MALEAHVGPENETGPAAVEEETRPTPALHLERLERAVADDWKRIREDLKLAGAEVGAGATCAASDFLPAVAARSNRPSAKEAAQNRNRERRYRGADRRKTMADDEKPGAHDCGGGLRRVPRVAYFAADRKGLRGLLERLSASGYKVNRLEPTLKACSALPGSPPDMIVADLTLMAAQVRGVLAALSKSQFTRDIPTVVVGAAADELKLARDAAPQAREFYKGPVKLEELVDILGRPRPGAVSPERAKRIR
jgi:CheY-like chemotaxis protein